MTSPRIRAAAARLTELRTHVAVVEALEPDANPQSLDEAYAVQDALIEALPGDIIGWKIGATALETQAKLGASEPFAGPLLAPRCHPSPASLSKADFTHTLIESEFAFRMARSLAPRTEPYSREEVESAIGSILPAIEIVGASFTPAVGGELFPRVADLGVNAGAVFGSETTDWRQFDLPNHEVVLSVGGEAVANGRGEIVLGDPITALVWLVNHLSTRGRTLGADEIISTGTVTGMYDLSQGAKAVADFGKLGTVELTLTA